MRTENQNIEKLDLNVWANGLGQVVNFKLDHATYNASGHGHKEVTLSLEFKGEVKDFTTTTSDMQAIDEISELSGEEKYLALYNLVIGQIEEIVQDWLGDIIEKDNE